MIQKSNSWLMYRMETRIRWLKQVVEVQLMFRYAPVYTSITSNMLGDYLNHAFSCLARDLR